jgi:hypothetical protein
MPPVIMNDGDERDCHPFKSSLDLVFYIARSLLYLLANAYCTLSSGSAPDFPSHPLAALVKFAKLLSCNPIGRHSHKLVLFNIRAGPL